MAGQLNIRTVKLGDSADASKNFLISTPAVPDGTLTIERENGTAVLSVDAAGKVTFDPATLVLKNPVPLGYGTGAGGTVTQATSKSTAVTLNKPCGQITMNNAALAAGATVGFTLSNSLIAANDLVVINVKGVDGFDYNVWAYDISSGYTGVAVKNVSTGSLSEAIVLSFAIIKGATA